MERIYPFVRISLGLVALTTSILLGLDMQLEIGTHLRVLDRRCRKTGAMIGRWCTTQMRIGALLRTPDGPFDFVRKKGNKNTVLGRDDKPHPDAGRLDQILGDVNRDIFSQMFAIDHERLRAGGQSLEEGLALEARLSPCQGWSRPCA